MTGAASIAAVLLATVFGWAAIAKVVRHRSTVDAFTALGLRGPRLLSLAVPVAEVMVAVLLLVRPTAGGASALFALMVFTIVIVRAVAAGATAPCGCFGSRRVEPVTPSDVIRNGLLAAFAVVATGTSRLVRPSVGAVGVMAASLAVASGAQAVAHRMLGAQAGRAQA